MTTATDIAAIIEGTRPQDLLGWLSTFEADDLVCEGMDMHNCILHNYFTAHVSGHIFLYVSATSVLWDSERANLPKWAQEYIWEIFRKVPVNKQGNTSVTAQQAIDLLGPYLTEAQMASAIAGE